MKLDERYLSFCTVLEKEKKTNLRRIKTCFTLLSVAKKIDQQCAQRLLKFKLSESRFIILVLLKEYTKLPLQDISKLLGIKKASTTTLISSLVEDRLIQKQNFNADKRIYLVSLTDSGAQLVEKVLSQHSIWIEKMTNSLTEDEMNSFNKILNKIYKNI
ncbi:MarR family winged helix-turn-helix transcriptional regulator [Gilliamella sp. ESL0443]|uniref:MarR family winged helix-turn-helix transcriptional regulator n=1 Tax=Gilliamella sp. ESL0443 TaxID=2704655 RepID=UPI001C69EFC1|nr:MarR family transcriptional regulator [Gilliamella sp. ESL0443]QYN42498.1 MarR family transcriptional regulator [Gilliamella sp. ESL0443]